MLDGFPPRSPGRQIRLIIIITLIAIDAVIVIAMVTPPLAVPTFLLGPIILFPIPVVGIVAALAVNLNAAHYSAEGDHIIVDWGRFQQAVHIGHIQEIESGTDSDAEICIIGIRWPRIIYELD